MLASVQRHNPSWTPRVVFGDRGVSEDSVTEALGDQVKLFFCLWHITSQNMPTHWGKLPKYKDMSTRFKEIANCRTEAEYDIKYKKFKEDFPDGKQWMDLMHQVRTKWVLAWQLTCLTLGYRGNSVAESGNHASKSYLTFQQNVQEDESGFTNVLKGSLLYEHDVSNEENKYMAELEVRSSLPFAGNVYQTTIYNAGYSRYLCKNWSDEYVKTVNVDITKNEGNQKFDLRVTSTKTGKQYPQRVQMDTKTNMLQCSCNKVLRYGYPCSHLIAVMKHIHGPSPSLTGLCDTRYLHSRWKQEKVCTSC